MGLFKSKPKISIEESCQQFYDSQIFHAVVNGTDLWSSFLDAVKNSVVEAAPSFKAIDMNLFLREMTALRMEVFALAWLAKFKREKFTLTQSFVTWHYLVENGRLDIWDAMGEYNQALAQSITLTATGEQMAGRTGRARITYNNMQRVSLFDKWAEANIGDSSTPTEEEKMLAKCVARVANRIGVDMRRANCIATKQLAARLADRLGCDTNLRTEILFRLAAWTFGFYNGAKDYLKSVSLQ